jgi:hypothetical protein
MSAGLRIIKSPLTGALLNYSLGLTLVQDQPGDGTGMVVVRPRETRPYVGAEPGASRSELFLPGIAVSARLPPQLESEGQRVYASRGPP